MSSEKGGSIESKSDFKDTPRGNYQFWQQELAACSQRLAKWLKLGDKVVNLYLDSRADIQGEHGFKLNLFYSNITTLNALMYGNLPTVDVSRRYADSNDDVARVAAETMERLLNADIAENGDQYDAVLHGVLQDRLLPGLGCARVRYEMESEEDEMGVEQVTYEAAPIEYYHWRDVKWSWGRSFSDLTWISYKNYITKDEATERFGEDVAGKLQYKKQMVANEDEGEQDPDMESAWLKAEIEEIWDKASRQVIWISLGYDKVLDTKEDPLGLNGFFPSPPFFMANATTSLYHPTPDYKMSQDLYNEIDVLQTRIAILTEAVKAVGVYDKAAEGIERMYSEGVDNELIPVDNWALFAEKGGIKGAVDWVPIDAVTNALEKLVMLRDQTVALLQQVTGMSDIMQGGLQNQYEGVGQSQIKAKFGSIRIQQMQEEFAYFASGLLQIKAEVIARHFDPRTIAAQSNMQMSFDAELLPQAIELIKNPETARLKVAIRPESVAMTDFAQLQSERTGYITAISTFMQSAGPLMDSDPSAKPFLLQLLQWGLAGFKGSSDIESVIDKAIEASQRAEQEEQQPDPVMQVEQMKLQGEMQKIEAKKMADLEVRQADLQSDVQTIQATSQAKLTELQAKTQAGIMEEQAQSQINMDQQRAGVEAEAQKERLNAQNQAFVAQQEQQLDMEKRAFEAQLAEESEVRKQQREFELEDKKHANKMAEIAANRKPKPSSDVLN